jgi:hypothetical protein
VVRKILLFLKAQVQTSPFLLEIPKSFIQTEQEQEQLFLMLLLVLTVVDLKVQDDLTVTGDIDVDGTTNLDVVDIDGAVDMASTALVTGVLTTTAATVFNGGFASNAASTISTADNLDTLSLISTDADANSGPNLRLYRNSSSPANNDFLGFLEFEGRNNNSQDVIYGQFSWIYR